MASLNLIPNPSVLAVQTGLFLANIYVIKKLIVEPYMVVREQRDRLTVGSKDEAEHAIEESKKVFEYIKDALHSASLKVKDEREGLRQNALMQRKEIISAAEQEAKAEINDISQQIQKTLEVEKQKIPAVVQGLTTDVYSALLTH